jgi:uncharacterized YigZ family protein
MPAPDTYRTIEQKSDGIYRDRGSRFLAFAYPVQSTDEIKSILATLRKQYHDARHHCYAYRLGAAKNEFRSSDDGEPSGSAGKPILGQVRAFDLSNVLVVVVRYFGGTLLGVGGLIQAYRSAAADALRKARIIEAEETDPVHIRYPYPLTNEIMKIVEEEKIRIVEQVFTGDCSLLGRVRKSRLHGLLERINKLPGATAEPAGS